MEDLHEQLKNLKLRFRSLMNGPVSASMREKGLIYKVNFGVELPRLREIAEGIEKNHELAQALWKEDIRECRLMAAMLQPLDSFYPDIADIWVDGMRFTEEAECTVMNLFQYLPYASEKAFQWIADEREIFQQCGYLLLARLFMSGKYCNERAENEFLDQVGTALLSSSVALRKAAQSSLVKFMDLGEREEKEGEKIIKNLGKNE